MADVMRRMLRLTNPENKESLDAMLCGHLIELEQESPHRMQEWIRNALRNQFSQEQMVVGKRAEGSRDDA